MMMWCCMIQLSLLVLACSTASFCLAYNLQGKRVLVTGASGGIGRGIALLLGREHGCHVLVHYHTRSEGAQETLAALQDHAAGIVQADFRDPAEIHRMFAQLDEIWPEGLDVVVNNAGVVTKEALDDDDAYLTSWHETLAVNLHAPRLISQLAKRRMKQGGVILNVSSIHGEKSTEWMTAYAVSKSALDALTRGLALEYAADGIRVNGIAPGVVPVERTAPAFADEKVTTMWKEKLPLDALGTVEQIAEACVPLLTNDWITGTTWQIDGGMMARANFPDRPRPLKVGGTC